MINNLLLCHVFFRFVQICYDNIDEDSVHHQSSQIKQLNYKVWIRGDLLKSVMGTWTTGLHRSWVRWEVSGEDAVMCAIIKYFIICVSYDFQKLNCVSSEGQIIFMVGKGEFNHFDAIYTYRQGCQFSGCGPDFRMTWSWYQDNHGILPYKYKRIGKCTSGNGQAF